MKSITQFLVLLISLLILNSNTSVFAQQWKLAGSVPNPGATPSISVYNNNIVWIAGGAPGAPKVFQTNNAGQNWTSVTTEGTSSELLCIWAIGPNLAIAGEGSTNSYAKLYKFASNGLRWDAILSTGMNDGGFNNIIFSRNNPLVGCALADEFYLTTDGGNIWTRIQTGAVGVSSAQNSLMLVDQNFFGFGLKNGASRVRMTLDGGNSWLTKSINLTGNVTSGFTFRDDKLIGISSTSSSMPYIARTTDGGNSWNPVDVGAGLSGMTVIKWIPSTNVVYILGENGAIKRSTNNGLNWTSMTTAGVTGLTHFDFNKVNNIICGFAVSSNGSVIKLVDSVLVLTGTGHNENISPSEFRLYQNYPNPFNPSTDIKYHIKANSFVSLKVFDMLGREVATLVNEYQKAGTYSVKFALNQNSNVQISSGTYFYRINADGFTDIKPMMLIK